VKTLIEPLGSVHPRFYGGLIFVAFHVYWFICPLCLVSNVEYVSGLSI
jgi:hypothetical protein